MTHVCAVSCVELNTTFMRLQLENTLQEASLGPPKLVVSFFKLCRTHFP